jgi:hypothetical protein
VSSQAEPTNTKEIFFCHAGPMITYGPDQTLWIGDLNPQVEMTWHMPRSELFRIGLRCIAAAIFPPKLSA